MRFFFLHPTEETKSYQKTSEWIVFENPLKTFVIYDHDSERTENEIESFFDELSKNNPYYFAGFFSFELSKYLLPLPKQSKPFLIKLPLVYGGFFENYHKVSWEDTKIDFFIRGFRLEEVFSEYKKNILKIRDLISQGKVYQVNYTFPVVCEVYGNLMSLFYHLWKNQRTLSSVMVMDSDFSILSVSPEIFFLQREKEILVKPMKGTQQPSKSLRKLINNIKYLRTNPKEVSENAMIVDLFRNDLGRISEIGSVKIKNLFAIEIHPTVIQMITEIQARLRHFPREKRFWETLFPSGSVTGAPKIEAIKHIQQLEKYQRGVYTGAIGWLAPKNSFGFFNVAIRTLVVKSNRGYYYVGSGITYDSHPKSEYKECLLKSKVLKQLQRSTKPKYIFTTMKFCGGIFYFEKSHLERLKATKSFFQIPVNNSKIESKFQRLKKCLKHVKRLVRVHFRIYQNGKIQIFLDYLSKKKEIIFGISNQPVDEKNLFLYYKTSERSYQVQLDEAIKTGLDEMLLLNTKNQITEGTYTNIIIKKNGKFYTPPLSDGLLNGIMRRKLIQKLKIEETSLTLDDVKKADCVYFVNSVRGILKGRIKE
ncbi:MAG: chorismate-binding protein [Leptospiraceae bacterium]|nr:chorismate-binding protein [Leptospiraceae bacterium]MDW7974952.1 chorismate-binding protein [Leptospiraceae bacterium]